MQIVITADISTFDGMDLSATEKLDTIKDMIEAGSFSLTAPEVTALDISIAHTA